MNQLVERMLAVGSGFAPVDGAGLVGHFVSLDGYMFPVALHRELLQNAGNRLGIARRAKRRQSARQRSRCTRVPEAPSGREVAVEWRGPEMLIHLVQAVQHGAEIIRADRDHRRGRLPTIEYRPPTQSQNSNMWRYRCRSSQLLTRSSRQPQNVCDRLLVVSQPGKRPGASRAGMVMVSRVVNVSKR